MSEPHLPPEHRACRDRTDAEVEHLLGIAADGDRPTCGGLPGSCPECIALYHLVAGYDRPICLICEQKHYAYEEHA